MNSGKKYYYIGEVADEVGLKEHVLRFWEKEFEFLRPVTNNANHRKYTIRDINLIKKIKYLVYDEKYTIPGARQKILELKKRNISIFDEFDPDVFNSGIPAQQKVQTTEKQSTTVSGDNLSKAIQNIANTIDNSLIKEETRQQTIQPQNQFQNTKISGQTNQVYSRKKEVVQNQINPDNVFPISKSELIRTLQDILSLLN